MDDPQIPPLADDRTAMMLGLVPDKREPIERLVDAIRTGGESLRYRYEPPVEQQCAELKCPCGCGKVVRTWHGPNCPEDCPI